MADTPKQPIDPATMKWAIEQAVALHSRSGVTTEILLAEARKIYDAATAKE